MKYRVFVLLLVMLLLCGCEEVKVPDDTTVSLQVTGATVETATPQETTAPQETTEPTETTQATKPPFPPETQPAVVPTDPPADTQLITVTEEAPLYDTEQSWLLVTPGQDNEYFKSTYVHLPGYAAIDERRAYDGKYIYVNTEESPTLRGNHHDAYVLYDAWMEKLENQHFYYEWEFFGCKTVLEFDYVIRGEDVLITYSPHEANYESNGSYQSYGRVVDTSRGRNELLIKFQLFPTETSHLWYYASLDLDTGKLNYFLSQFDRSVFEKGDPSLLEWLPDGDMLLVDGWEPRTIYHMDIQRTKIHDLGENIDLNLSYRCSDGNHVIFSAEAGYNSSLDVPTSKINHPYQYQFYQYDFDSGEVTLLLEGGLHSFPYESPLITYRDDDKNFQAHNLLTGQDTVLYGATSILSRSDSFVIYRDGENKLYLHDMTLGDTVLLDLPATYDRNYFIPSPDGRRFMTCGGKNGCFSLQIYDCDTKTFLEIQRTNANPLREDLPFWAADDKMLLYCNNGNMYRDIVVFEFK